MCYYRKGDCASVRSAAVCDPISSQTFPVPFWQSHQLCCWTVEIIGTLCRADTSGDSSMSLRGIRSRLRQGGGGGGSGSGGGCDSDQGSPSRSASFFQQLAAFLGPDEPTSSKGSYSQEVSFSILLLFHICVCVCLGLFFFLSISAAHINFRSRFFFPDRYPGVGSSRLFVLIDDTHTHTPN